MRKVAGDKAGIKASDGIRDLKDLKAMARAGATRIGASSGAAIMDGEAVEGEYR